MNLIGTRSTLIEKKSEKGTLEILWIYHRGCAHSIEAIEVYCSDFFQDWITVPFESLNEHRQKLVVEALDAQFEREREIAKENYNKDIA